MIAMIAAMQAEVDAMLLLMEKPKKVCRDHITFWEAKNKGQPIVLMLSGVGKGFAVLSTTLLIKHYQPTLIINIGTAGGLCENEQVLDVVIGKEVIQHDYDTSAFDGPAGLGLSFSASSFACALCERVCKRMKVRYHSGLIVSGDQFISTPKQIEAIKQNYPDALCAEMEAGGIAQVCSHFHIPFAILRSLSDIVLHENNQLTYSEYVSVAAQRSASMCALILEEIA